MTQSESHRIIQLLEEIRDRLAASSPSASPKPHAVRAGYDQIIQAVCDYFALTKFDLLHPPRPRDNSYARMLAMYLLRQHTTLKVIEIAALFHCSHSNISNLCARVRGFIENNTGEARDVAEIIAMIESRSGK